MADILEFDPALCAVDEWIDDLESLAWHDRETASRSSRPSTDCCDRFGRIEACGHAVRQEPEQPNARRRSDLFPCGDVMVGRSIGQLQCLRCSLRMRESADGRLALSWPA
jgi:hypothetical protein